MTVQIPSEGMFGERRTSRRCTMPISTSRRVSIWLERSFAFRICRVRQSPMVGVQRFGFSSLIFVREVVSSTSQMQKPRAWAAGR